MDPQHSAYLVPVPPGVVDQILLPELGVCGEGEVVQGLVVPGRCVAVGGGGSGDDLWFRLQ